MKRKAIITISIAVAALILIGMLSVRFIKKNSITRNLNSVYFIISPNMTVDKLAEDLKSKGIIKYKAYFKMQLWRLGLQGEIKESKLIIKSGTNIDALIGRIQNQKSDFEIITIPEGFSLYQIADRLEKYHLVNKKNFMNISLKALNDNLINEQKQNKIFEIEGFLFPNTYYIPFGTSEKDIALLMYNDFKMVFSDKYIERTKELGLSINEVITIASLIEREAANNEERSRIAGVIYNRLKKGIPLQIDAAVIYANTQGEGKLERVLSSNLKYVSPYNTYLYKGLPPGPIASPGKPSIEAALYPENHEFLYYVLGEKGHVFSKTYEEHLKNVKVYRESLKRK